MPVAHASFKPTLSEEERSAARALRMALEPFYAMRPNVPLSYLRTFLLIAEEEGLGVNDYAGIGDIAPSVMTRNILDIGTLNRHKEEGLALVANDRDPYDLRKHNVRVTPKGRALVRQWVTVLRSYCKG
jgi:DNA-binding MarR family transcriptional regulator